MVELPAPLRRIVRALAGAVDELLNTPSPALLPPPPFHALRTTARTWLTERPPATPAELPALLAQAERFVAERHRGHYIPPRDLKNAVLLAWARLDGEASRCHVDLAQSTPHLIVLVDPVAGVSRQIPVSDLIRFLGPRSAAPLSPPAA